MPEPEGATDQKSKIELSIYPYKLSFLQIYKKFRDIVASPNVELYETERKMKSMNKRKWGFSNLEISKFWLSFLAGKRWRHLAYF